MLGLWGLLLALPIALGSLLPRFRSNFFFGIRTPCTLSSETVWKRTHRVGGYVRVLMGRLMVAGLMGTARWLTVAIEGAFDLAMFVLVYSYVIWRAEQRPR